jgi:hypothetical protein
MNEIGHEENKERKRLVAQKHQEEQAEAFWNSPEGRHVKRAKEIRQEIERQEMELKAEIRKQALEEELRIMEELHAKTKGR